VACSREEIKKELRGHKKIPGYVGCQTSIDRVREEGCKSTRPCTLPHMQVCHNIHLWILLEFLYVILA
jgi:hypothetical protein